MKSSVSKWLLPLAGLLVLAAIFLRPTAEQAATSNEPLLPNLAQQLNNVERVELRSAGDTLAIALVKNDEQWGLEQRNGYPIVIDSLRTMLRALAQLKTDEAMTSNPEYYSRLGLTDIANANSAAKAIRIYNANGEKIAGLLLGNSMYRGGNEYSYLRVEGQAQSWLVQGGLDLLLKPERWLNRDLLNISRDDIQQVHIYHPDGEELLVKRENEDDKHLSVQNLPEGAELLYPSVGNGPAEALQSLVFDDVQTTADFDWQADNIVTTRLARKDGLVIVSKAERRETQYFIELSAEYNGDDATLAAEANELNQKFNGWVYRIQPYKYQALAKRMENMLKTKDE